MVSCSSPVATSPCALGAQADVDFKKALKRHDEGRVSNNRRQPEGLPRFTDVGFKKSRVPDDVWDVLKTYYEENK